jgi:heterodisulfide reductase subunit A
MSVKITINGTEYEAEEGQSILDVAKENKVEIPTLCFNQNLEPYGGCRLCLVEVEERGRKSLKTSCTYPVSEGLVVETDSQDVLVSRKLTVEHLLARCPEEEVVLKLAKDYGIEKARFKSRDDNCIMCGMCVRMCKRMGRFAISFQNRGFDKELGTPFMKPNAACITCGACNFICPTSRFTPDKVERNSGNEPIPKTSPYEEQLKQEGNVSIYFTQAVPNTPVIDKENCIHFQLGACEICQDACAAGAIDFEQEDEEVKLNVGSIILSPGFDEFNPEIKKELGYGTVKNVVTSIEFERILCASGPFEGHIQRLSDHKEPKTIAFIQCVGSRDASCGNEYCSAVCCMYSIKEAIIAQEHTPGLQTEIFFMDMRAFGKEFDDYYTRAQEEHGIKFTRSRIANIAQGPDDSVLIDYIEDNEIRTKEFDLAVLAVGLESTETAKELGEKFGIELNKYNFVKTDTFAPLETSSSGIFVSGAFNGPKDIPDTVAQASGAAAKASSLISEARGSLVTEKEYPPEKDVSGLEPRVGVFVCHCGINIGGVVDVPKVMEYAKTLPNVVYAEQNLYTCSQDTQEQIKEIIDKHDINRIVVASCTPRTHEPLFRATTREGGINPYLFEMANIRDQCSWVHMHEPEAATEKAKDLVRMIVAKASLLEPLSNPSIDVTKEAMVIGGGLSGMSAALEIASNGFKTYLIEQEAELGGNLRDIHFEAGNVGDPQEFLADLKKQVEQNPLIELHLNKTVKSIDGFIGNFETVLSDDTKIEHGVIIVATGGKEYQPSEYLYGSNEKVVTQKELEKKLVDGDVPKGSVVMIQCVGSRTEERPYCSRICCTTAITNALKIKELSPETEIYVLYKDIRTYAFKEDFYKEAAAKGVKFIRFEDENKPEVTEEDGLTIRVKDLVLDDVLEFKPETLVLSTAVVPNESNKELAKLLKVPLSKDKFFLEAHMKLRPVEFATDGIFLCGLAHWPKFMDESISQASATVSRALTILSKEKLEAEGVVATVDEELCSGCATCVAVCPYGAPQKSAETGKVEINEVTCKGCGTCVASCPERAINLPFFSDEQLSSQVEAVAKGEGEEISVEEGAA